VSKAGVTSAVAAAGATAPAGGRDGQARPLLVDLSDSFRSAMTRRGRRACAVGLTRLVVRWWGTQSEGELLAVAGPSEIED